MKAVIRKNGNRSQPMEVRLISDAYRVAVQTPDNKFAFPINIEEVFFDSEGVKQVMASEHFYIIQKSHEPVFVSTCSGDYVFAFKKKKKAYSYAG